MGGAFLVAFGGAVVLGLLRGLPRPAVHDEFAYLLAAETFASGRLTNPTHPHWQHFETFHVVHEPSYQSKYPPAQGLVLALGAVVGEPAIGLWISSGLLAASLFLALLAWLPRHWAGLVTLVGAPHLVWFSYWGTSYWGGAVTAVGGALALAGVGISRRRFAPRTRWAPVLVAAGLAILALSRPFEGLVFAIGLGIGESVCWLRGRPCLLRPFDPAAAFAAVVLLAGSLAWFGYYNHRTTGSPTTMLYQVHQREYAATPSLITGGAGELPEYRHPEMERYWREWGLERHERFRERRFDPQFQLGRAALVLILLFGPGLVLFAGVFFDRARMLRRALTPATTLVVVLLAVLATKGAYPHYAAPAAASGLALAGAGIMGIRRRARWKGTLDITTLALIIWAATPGIRALVNEGASPFAERRAEVIAHLQGSPGPDLVLVDHGPRHNVHREWVYNAADIDASPIVWARAMAPEQNRALLRYFGGRTIWCLQVDEKVSLRRFSDGDTCGSQDPRS